MFTVFHIRCGSKAEIKAIAKDFSESSFFSNFNPELVEDLRLSLDISTKNLVSEHFDEITSFLNALNNWFDNLDNSSHFKFSLDTAIEPDDLRGCNLLEIPTPKNVLNIASKLNIELLMTIYPPSLE